jgi:hypothetical protein
VESQRCIFIKVKQGVTSKGRKGKAAGAAVAVAVAVEVLIIIISTLNRG